LDRIIGSFFLWLLLIFSPAIAAANGATDYAESTYSLFSNICHQMPSRSFHVLEHKLGVCSRCIGVYFGLFAGALAYPVFREISTIEPLPRVWLILSMFPIGIDWALTFFGFWENTFFSRFTTGMILGVACAVFIIPALSELATMFHERGKSIAKEAA